MSEQHCTTEIWIAIASWALVGVTAVLVFVTVRLGNKQLGVATDLAKQQNEALRAELKARLQLQFADRFDSPGGVTARKQLASHYLNKRPIDETPETVLEFFEDLGLFWRRGYLDGELIWSTFGFFGVRWWAVCKDYILEERKRQSDETLFDEFKKLNQMFLSRDEAAGNTEATESDLIRFLEDERDL